MKNALIVISAIGCLNAYVHSAPARLKTNTGCHIDAVYQSENGFAVHFSDCTATVGSNEISTVYHVTNFSDDPSKAYLSTFLTAMSMGTGVAVTYDNAVSNNLYNLSIMKHPDHSGSLALKLLDVQVSY